MPKNDQPFNEDHPSDQLLIDWTAGALTDDKTTEIDGHLELCNVCAERLDSLEHPLDALVERLRSADRNLDARHTLSSPLEHSDNLRFGVAALELGVLTPERFAQACRLWVARGGHETLAGVLIAKGWIERSDRERVEASLSDVGSPEDMPHQKADKTLAGGVEPTSKMLVVHPISTSRIQLQQVHSTGGSGRVWRAYDTILKRDIALKELLPEFTNSQKHRDRFHREACITAQLQHPGTVPLHEYRDKAGRPYYTMKFVTGQTLSEVIEEVYASTPSWGDGELNSLFRLLSLFMRACDTIAYAHSQGIIHRDLKGDNILIGEFGEVTVIDWGLAKQIELPSEEAKLAVPDRASATMKGERLGTPAYMAPEQVLGDVASIDARTDVYGLASLLYEILVGRPPFVGETIDDVLAQVTSQLPAPPHVMQPGLPAELESICLRGLAKLRDDRQQSVVELRDAIREWVAHQAELQRDTDARTQFFSLSNDLFVTLDEVGRITHVNPAYQELLGRKPGESPGKHYIEGLHPDDRELATKIFRTVSQGGQEPPQVLRVQAQDGSYFRISWTLSRAPGSQETCAIGRDVTKDWHAEKLMEAIVASSPDGIVVVDDQGKMIFCNDRLCEVYGYQPEEIIGQPMDLITPERFREQYRKNVDIYLKSKRDLPMGSESAFRGLRKDGSEIEVDASRNSLQIGNEKLLIATIRFRHLGNV